MIITNMRDLAYSHHHIPASQSQHHISNITGLTATYVATTTLTREGKEKYYNLSTNEGMQV